MSIDDAMREACREVGIVPPRHAPPGRWVRVPVEGKAKSNRSGAVQIFDDERRGLAWNWITGQQVRFAAGDAIVQAQRDPEAERKQREAMACKERERAEVARICQMILDRCTVDHHPYLTAKGFPTEKRLVWDRTGLPDTPAGERIHAALPEGSEPLLVIPGHRGGHLQTLQFITDAGVKKNVIGGAMGGSSYRLCSGRETWVCEGIATALTVRDALHLLGRSVAVLAAFSASNVGQVASGIPGAIVAADHDTTNDHLGGLGAGEYYARKSGRKWAQPDEIEDWNDMSQREGLRAVALVLRPLTIS